MSEYQKPLPGMPFREEVCDCRPKDGAHDWTCAGWIGSWEHVDGAWWLMNHGERSIKAPMHPLHIAYAANARVLDVIASNPSSQPSDGNRAGTGSEPKAEPHSAEPLPRSTCEFRHNWRGAQCETCGEARYIPPEEPRHRRPSSRRTTDNIGALYDYGLMMSDRLTLGRNEGKRMQAIWEAR